MAKRKKYIFKELENKSASYHFYLDAKYEAGMVLTGTEVKSIKSGRVNFADSFCLFLNDELFIRSLNITEYNFGTHNNHNPMQDRKLLLTKKELNKIHSKIKERGYTVVPTRLFIAESGFIKCEIALARGKKIYDKRDSIKERDVKRELDRN
jgi:SsrA-binding protein